MENRILIIDDENKIRMILESLLTDEGYLVKGAANGHEGLDLVESFNPDLIILDMKMPGISGEEVLQQLTKSAFDGKIIILTAFGSIPNAVKAIHSGAFDYITKPFDTPDLLLTVKRAVNQVNLERELKRANRIIKENYSIDGIVTNNSGMKKLLELIKRAAASNTSILIQGASGTGKELFAKAIHQHSARKNNNYVAINCGAIPESLIESELFGYRRGAFSGAVSDKKGLFTEADGGTLFLDEIAEMPMEAQVKLLRVTQSGEYIPIGDTKTKKVDVRIVAASNKPLEEAVAQGVFREDLFYRINVVKIDIPDLSARIDDIPLLVKHFLGNLKRDQNISMEHCSPEAMRLLQSYNWPGNVRELENVIAGAAALSENIVLQPGDLPEKILQGKSLSPSNIPDSTSMHQLVSSQKEATEKSIILEALEACQHNQTKTAEYLGIGRRTLIRRLNKYGIK